MLRRPSSARRRAALPLRKGSRGDLAVTIRELLWATLRISFIDGITQCCSLHAAYLVHRRDNAMLLTTTGQMLFTMALFGMVAGALLLIAITVADGRGFVFDSG